MDKDSSGWLQLMSASILFENSSMLLLCPACGNRPDLLLQGGIARSREIASLAFSRTARAGDDRCIFLPIPRVLPVPLNHSSLGSNTQLDCAVMSCQLIAFFAGMCILQSVLIHSGQVPGQGLVAISAILLHSSICTATSAHLRKVA